MQNPRLAELNFRQLLHYGAQPPVQNTYAPPGIPCSGYCVKCEDTGITGLYRMSHAADTSDFEELLGQALPEPENHITEPVMFTLEDPGGEYDLGVDVPYRGHLKQPPTCHYYWTCEASLGWIRDRTTVLQHVNPYGPYFNYLLNIFHLKTAYFTNVRKCKFKDAPGDVGRVTRICVNEFLSREIEECHPGLIFCFGKNAYDILTNGTFSAGLDVVPLWHPKRRYKRRTDIVEVNDTLIAEALRRRGWRE